MAADDTPKGRTITDQAVQQITRVEELAYELQVQEVMCKDLKYLTPDMTMSMALDLFRAARISGAPVVKDEELMGVISLEDLIRCLTSGSTESTVESYMTRGIITVRCNEPVIEALKLFVNTSH